MDHAFYNSHLITKLQYGRKKLKDTSKSKNYTYNQKEEDIRFFYKFEDLLLSPKRKVYSNWQKDESVFDCKDESAKDYYIKSMEYYYLEGYKRIDFLLQYARIIGESDISLGNLKMLEHFIIDVCCPEICENNKFTVNKAKKIFTDQ